jgi:dihydroxyacid dehydratase/phosphogluconate dehydratase
MTAGFHIAASEPHLHLQLSGRLTAEDYHQLVPVIDREVKEHGRLRLLGELTDAFDGWTAGAAGKTSSSTSRTGATSSGSQSWAI